MDNNIPTGLKNVLEVYRLVRRSRCPRIKAVKEVARVRRIDPQTVISACTRSLGIGTADFDDFLTPKNSETFCELLIQRFPPYQKYIESFFQELDGKKDNRIEEPLGMIRTLFPNEKKDLLRLLLLNNVGKKLEIWSKCSGMPEDVRKEMVEIKKQIDNA
jgi:hypothetical protein